MTSNEKKVVFTLIGIFVAILVIVLIVKNVGNKPNTPSNNVSNKESVSTPDSYVSELANDVKLNNSKDLNSVKKYNNIEISNIQFTSQNGSSVLLADVKNTGTTKHEKEIVTITILGNDNSVITTIDAILVAIEPGQTEKLNAIVTADIVNAKDFTIKAK